MNQIPEFKFAGKPLPHNIASLLVRVLLANKSKPLSDEDRINNSQSAQIVLERIKSFNLPFMISSSFFAMSVCADLLNKPGECIILLWLCNQYYKKTCKTYLDINEWCEIFPDGIPTDKEMNNWWGSQKIHPNDRTNPFIDNKVDIAELWK